MLIYWSIGLYNTYRGLVKCMERGSRKYRLSYIFEKGTGRILNKERVIILSPIRHVL